VKTATKMRVHKESEGKQAMLKDWLKDEVHLEADRLEELIQEGLEYYGRKLDTALPENTRKFHMDHWRKTIEKMGVCFKCGLNHHSRKCASHPTCNECGPTSTHHSSVCQNKFRMCRMCGVAEPHQRTPCQGWWGPSQ
jgi:hypothetical protein